MSCRFSSQVRQCCEFGSLAIVHCEITVRIIYFCGNLKFWAGFGTGVCGEEGGRLS